MSQLPKHVPLPAPGLFDDFPFEELRTRELSHIERILMCEGIRQLQESARVVRLVNKEYTR